MPRLTRVLVSFVFLDTTRLAVAVEHTDRARDLWILGKLVIGKGRAWRRVHGIVEWGAALVFD